MIFYITAEQAEELKRRALMAQGITPADLENIERAAERETGAADLLAKYQQANREYYGHRTRATLRALDESERAYMNANREKESRAAAMLRDLIRERATA